MSERDEQHESEFECPGCGRFFNGPWSLSYHTERCKKFLLKESPCSECGSPGCNGECAGDDMMGASS